ncbi:sterol carrier protein domain-containing protein, partial [Streptomyces sp. NPDC054912]
GGPPRLLLAAQGSHGPGRNTAPRFRLKAGPAGAAWEPARADPDLTLDVRELAACYLGGTLMTELVAAGLVTERTPGAAAALDAALRTDVLPHTADEF